MAARALIRTQGLGAGAIALCIAVAGCDRAAPTEPGGPGPTIQSLTPAVSLENTSPQNVTVTGTGFLSGLTLAVTDPNGSVALYGQPVIDNLQSGSFNVTITLAIAGQYSFTVKNVAGSASTPVFLRVLPASAPGPLITGFSPGSFIRSASPQAVDLVGVHFLQGLTAQVTDPSGFQTMLDASAIGLVTPTFAEVSVVFNRAGLYVLSVTNPSGDASNAVVVSVH